MIRLDLVVPALLLAACTQRPTIIPTRVSGFVAWSDQPAPHLLAAGDEIDMRFLLNPDLDQTRLTVGPDGRVTVPLLGSVPAAGRGIDAFRAGLETQYASVLRLPRLDVLIHGYGSSRIYVGGEVHTQGVQLLQGPTNVLQGVMLAGGLLDSARASQVVLIRRAPDGRPMLRTVDLRRFIGSADPQDDVPLQAADVLFVPKTDIASFDQFVDEYLNKAIPFSKSLNYNLGNGATFF